MQDSGLMPDPATLIAELQKLINNPDAFSAERQEIIQLSRKAAVALEEPFEMLQRLAYSVCAIVSYQLQD